MEQLSHHSLSHFVLSYSCSRVDVVPYLLGSWNRLYHRGLGWWWRPQRCYAGCSVWPSLWVLHPGLETWVGGNFILDWRHTLLVLKEKNMRISNLYIWTAILNKCSSTPTPSVLEPPMHSLWPRGFLALPSQAESLKHSEPQWLPTFGLNQW